MILITTAIGTLLLSNSNPPFKCGKAFWQNRPYGKVRVTVDCSDKTEYNSVSVCERKGEVFHGACVHYDSLWRKKDSSFYQDDEEHGRFLIWDTTGNVLATGELREGRNVGKHVSDFAPGKPHYIKHYNDSGQLHGLWQEWWLNGNKKNEIKAARGQILEATEHYPTGKPRIRYRVKEEAGPTTILDTKYIEGEAWAPDGRPAGKVVKGNGTWLVFPKEPTGKPPVVFKEVRRDSLLADVEELDSARAMRWVDSLARAAKPSPANR